MLVFLFTVGAIKSVLRDLREVGTNTFYLNVKGKVKVK